MKEVSNSIQVVFFYGYGLHEAQRPESAFLLACVRLPTSGFPGQRKRRSTLGGGGLRIVGSPNQEYFSTSRANKSWVYRAATGTCVLRGETRDWMKKFGLRE